MHILPSGESLTVPNTPASGARGHETLRRRSKLMQTLTGVGSVIAYTLLAVMPELGSISASTAAALAWLAPYDRDSGKERGRRRIPVQAGDKPSQAGASALLPVPGGKSRDPPPRGLPHFRGAAHEKGQTLQGCRNAVMRELNASAAPC